MNAPDKMKNYANYGDPWIQTFTATGIGGAVPLENPQPIHINFVSVAHHLACTNRFLGATRIPISIAQHSIHIADRMPPRLRGRGLFHDGHEFAVNDNSTPFKRLIEILVGRPVISEIEAKHDRAIFAAAGLDLEISALDRDLLKTEDLRALMTERRDLCEKTPAPWIVDSFGVEPWFEKIECWPWWYAEIQFLDRIREYLPDLFALHATEIRARIGELRHLSVSEWERTAKFVAEVRP